MSRRCHLSPSGFSIVELMVAIFILSTVTFALFHGLHTADKIRGRADINKAASTLAFSEAERIRNAAYHGTILEDSTYTQTVRGITFTISRKVQNSLTDLTEHEQPMECEIVVKPEIANHPSHTFKLIQGIGNGFY